MGLLKTPVTSVYLAGPIDFGPNPGDWRTIAAEILKKHNIVCFNPFAAFQPAPSASRPAAEYIREINYAALRASSVMLLNVEPSLGSGDEFGICRAINTPVVGFGPKSIQSFSFLSYKQAYPFNTLEAAVQEIVDSLY